MSEGRYIVSEVNIGTCRVSGIQDVNGPDPLAYNGEYLVAWRVPEGFMFRVGEDRVLLGYKETNLLRDWLKDATYDGV